MLVIENTEKIGELLKSGSSLKGGNCHFIDLENGWGIKAWHRDLDTLGELRNLPEGETGETLRDDAFLCQEYASRYGLAPKVGAKFEIGEYYCHTTEVVETVIEWGGYDSDNGHESVADENWYVELQARFMLRCEEIFGFTPHDMWEGNYGWNKDKTEFLAIDWDREDAIARKIEELI